MTTQQFIKELENKVRILEVRAVMEDDPVKRDSIQKRIAVRTKLLNAVRKVWGKNGIEYAALYQNKDDEE